MTATRPTQVRQWLAELNLRPSRRLGQNFLVDGNIARMVVDLAELQPGDRVLEIGPGCGALTEELLARGTYVAAVEVDPRLVRLLQERLGGTAAVTLVCADALAADLEVWLGSGFDRVVANLPYSVGTRILVHLFEQPHPPRRLVVTLQREVVARIVAPPSTPSYGLLSVLAQHLYTVSRPRSIAPTCFYPQPEVESAVVRLDRRDRPLGEPVHVAALARLLKQVFGARRKQLRRALERSGFDAAMLDSAGTWEKLGISPTDRPEALDPAAWTRLARALGLPPPGSEAPPCG